MRRSLALALLVASPLTPAAAPRLAGAQLPSLPGTFTERVTARADTTQRYAQYVPGAYRSGEPRPVLFLMDPRARALVPLARVAAEAERLGWIVLSSWNTMSDGPGDPNVPALNAMLEDVQDRLTIDTRRLYLAGFSGTARVSWRIARELRGPVAGLLAVGAGLPQENPTWVRPFARDSTFAVFAAVGTLDFNHDEVLSLGRWLAAEQVPHRVVAFDGPHAWPPEAVLASGMRWLELQAMRGGRRAVDTALVRALRTQAIDEARVLSAAGQRVEALDAWRAVATGFAPWGGVDEARAVADSLAADPAVRRLAEARQRQAAADEARRARLLAALRETREGKHRDARALRRALDLDGLQRVAGAAGDSVAAPGARRLLEWLFAMTSFYEAREAVAARDPARAARLLDVAASIRPLVPELCAQAMQAHRAAGASREAAHYEACAGGGAPVGPP